MVRKIDSKKKIDYTIVSIDQESYTVLLKKALALNYVEGQRYSDPVANLMSAIAKEEIKLTKGCATKD